mmetsp:Transcript_6547/g.11536  ORF Transcript_6547/g.11536 Transcript_6547/m.11536 type:complete len:125 (-) Transcript_6547:346-720(-)
MYYRKVYCRTFHVNRDCVWIGPLQNGTSRTEVLQWMEKEFGTTIQTLNVWDAYEARKICESAHVEPYIGTQVFAVVKFTNETSADQAICKVEDNPESLQQPFRTNQGIRLEHLHPPWRVLVKNV